MGALDVILQLVQELDEKVDVLPEKLKLAGPQVIIGTLDELGTNVGLLKSGELRSGNARTPGDSFSGLRISAALMPYPSTSAADSDQYNLVGLDADTMRFGLRSSDGVAVYGGGVAELTRDGVAITDTSDKPAFYALTQDATINEEALTAGDVLLGDNSTGKPNVLFDRSEGKLQFRYGADVIRELIVAEGGFADIGARAVMSGGKDTTSDWFGFVPWEATDSPYTFVDFDLTTYDDAGFWDSDRPERLTVPSGHAGVYQVGSMHRLVDASGSGSYEAAVVHLKEGTTTDDTSIAESFRVLAYDLDIAVVELGVELGTSMISEVSLSSGDWVTLYIGPHMYNSDDWTYLEESPLGATDPVYPYLYLKRIR